MKIKKNEIFFFVGIIFLAIKLLIEETLLLKNIENDIVDILLLFSYIFLTINILNNILTINKLKYAFICGILLIIGIATYYFSGYTGFFSLVLIMLSSINIDLKKIIKVLFVFNFFVLVLHIGIYICNLIFNIDELDIMLRTTNDGQIMRHSFFFKHPNVFSMYVFWTIAMYFYLKYEKLSTIDYAVTILISMYVYIYPNSRTSCVALILLVLFTLLEKKEFLSIKFVKISIISIILISILSIFMIENPIISAIDNALSCRMSLAHIIYNKYGINLLGSDIRGGTEITAVNGRVFTSIKIIDGTYFALILNYGIIAFGIIFYTLMKLLNSNSFQKNGEKKVLILIWAIYAVSETSCMYIFLGFPLLFITEIIIGEKNEAN